METGTPLQERPVGWRHPNRNDNRKGCCHSSSLLFLLRLLPSPISLSTRLFDKRLAHSSSWQLLVVPPCLCHTHTRPICLNGVAVAVMRIFPQLKKEEKRSLGGWRTISPAATKSERIDWSRSKWKLGRKHVVQYWWRLESQTREETFFWLKGAKNLDETFFENARQPVKEAGRKPCLLPVRVNIPFDR